MGRGAEEAMTEKPFLERWSRRKAADRGEPPERAPAPAVPPKVEDAAPEASSQPPDTLSAEELAALPPVESLEPGSDIRGFLRPGVPTALKNAALRRMWLLTPAIRDHKDIAVDYAWDWNTPGGVPGDGGRLDPGKVAQWARQIAGREARAPRERKPAAAEQTAKPAEDAVPADPAARDPRPEPRDDPRAEARDGARDATPDTSAPAVRKRHGSARPD
jgi:hypothetical protein